MKAETIEKYNDLSKQIESLEIHLAKYNPKNKWVHMQVQDHHGNKGHVIQTYATKPPISTDIESIISTAYGEFLEKVNYHLTMKINELKDELDKL